MAGRSHGEEQCQHPYHLGAGIGAAEPPLPSPGVGPHPKHVAQKGPNRRQRGFDVVPPAVAPPTARPRRDRWNGGQPFGKQRRSLFLGATLAATKQAGRCVEQYKNNGHT